jgi:hypothetical protein
MPPGGDSQDSNFQKSSALEFAVADEAPENDNTKADTERRGVCVARRAGRRSIMEFLITMLKHSKPEIKNT